MTEPPELPTAVGNGHHPELSAAAQAVFENYSALAGQMGAICTLLAALPLPLMLGACKRHQSVSVLTLPAGVTAQQADELAQSLRNDERILDAAMVLQQTLFEIKAGR